MGSAAADARRAVHLPLLPSMRWGAMTAFGRWRAPCATGFPWMVRDACSARALPAVVLGKPDCEGRAWGVPTVALRARGAATDWED
jgi:hypothetical protein